MHLVLAIPASAAGQSLDLGSYALFAQQLRSKGLVVTAGNVGGNLGLLHVSGGLDAPNSRVASDRAELQTASTCSELFTNDLKGSDPGCGPAVPAVFPLFPDLATECGFPDPFPACDPGAPVDVPDGQSLSLAPGTYGDVIVRGPPGATLTLDGTTSSAACGCHATPALRRRPHGSHRTSLGGGGRLDAHQPRGGR